MKRTKIFRALALAGILSLLMLVIPASRALALDYDIELDPEEGEIGDEFDVTGDGWPQSDYDALIFKEVDIYFTSEEASGEVDDNDAIDDEVETYELLASNVDIDEGGDFEKLGIDVPSRLRDGSPDEDVKGGTYYVCVTMADDEDIKAVAEFTVIASEIVLDPEEGTVNTEVEISGTDFSDREDILVEYDNDVVEIVDGDTDTDSDGEFTCTVLIPESTAGDHTITVIDDGDREGSATFTVEPEITIDPTSAAPDDEVTVNGTGFGNKSEVSIYLGTTKVTNVDTDSDGSFEVAFDVPPETSGSYVVKAEDEDDNEATVDLTIAANITVSPITTQAAPGHVGQSVTIRGSGFEPEHVITVTYATTPVTVATVNSDANGSFTAVFETPPSEAGEHTITATDGIDTISTTFYMESTAPSAPVLLLPQPGVKAEQPVQFDWEPVLDDSSPVTYTLQVATDEDFSVSSLVLTQEGLTQAEYTLSEAEKLAPRSEEAPYYWRVKAIDAASNASAWSTKGTFYTSRFNLPPWMIHVWWGLGAMGAGLGGYWLGKKRAYYYY